MCSSAGSSYSFVAFSALVHAMVGKSHNRDKIFVREVLEPLSKRFPGEPGVPSFRDGRLHSFRHSFCSACANSGQVPEQLLMAGLGHQDSAMVRHFYHLHDGESRRPHESNGLSGGRQQAVW